MHREQFFTIKLDLRACILTEQNLVTGFRIQRYDISSLEDPAVPNRDNLPLDRFFGRRIRYNDAPRRTDALPLCGGRSRNRAMVERSLRTTYLCVDVIAQTDMK